ncbi:alpha/beta hydrolase [Pacificimonas sp. WHA3]|uniref:Alpha/beta hydrolase n=2 Tax=Pacificimonas pallii TaxID=2827236 RepID=A0ABS6SAK1_9SPHN|nr:alpha/beta hydrolase [Pacificimonas pallii]
MKIPAFASVILLLFVTPLHARDALRSEPLTIGTSHILSTHDAERRVNVVLPTGYGQDDQTYPMVLMLDAGLQQDFFLSLGIERWNQLWQRSVPAIFVGIETVDRQRELLPPTSSEPEQKRFPTAGESDGFRHWLSSEVLPLLREHYRDDGRAFLLGESAAGHFVVETWIKTPELFDGYAALSPSMQWNGQALSRNFAREAETDRPPLFISLADEGGDTEEGLLRFVSSVRSPMCYSDRRDDLVHANTLHGLLPEALQYLLPTGADWLAEYGLVLRCQASAAAEASE